MFRTTAFGWATVLLSALGAAIPCASFSPLSDIRVRDNVARSATGSNIFSGEPSIVLVNSRVLVAVGSEPHESHRTSKTKAAQTHSRTARARCGQSYAEIGRDVVVVFFHSHRPRGKHRDLLWRFGGPKTIDSLRKFFLR